MAAAEGQARIRAVLNRVLAALAAVFLTASLVTETAVRSLLPLGRVFAYAGLAFLVLAVLAPYRTRPPEVPVSEQPHFGKTRAGLHVHLRTIDHLPRGNAVQRANAWLAVKITGAVSTMYCAYIFAAFDILALPTAVKGGLYGIVQWVASFFLQLVLLSIIMVGQDVQARASDARAAKTFEDAELIADRLDTRTEGGITDVLGAVRALDQHVSSQDAILQALIGQAPKRLATPKERGEGRSM